MLNLLLVNSGYYTWFVLPFLIFIARVADVSIGTVRVIFISRGLKYLAPIVGFIEILILLLAIGQIMKNQSILLDRGGRIRGKRNISGKKKLAERWIKRYFLCVSKGQMKA